MYIRNGAFFSFILLIIGCTKESVELNNTDLIFHNSYHLQIKPYSYTGENGKFYLCQGDTILYTQTPDTFDSRPLLKWDSIGFKLYTVAIFDSQIIVEGKTIKNIGNIKWQWNSGMISATSFEGNVKYIEGNNVINGIPKFGEETNPLDTGKYYWAVWGWNLEGNKILYSSRQMCFYVH
jgi:hypothetical protein